VSTTDFYGISLVSHLLIHVNFVSCYHPCTSYSGVLFGWLVLQAASAPPGSSVRMFGMLTVPAWASPFAALLVTHLIVPNASWTVRNWIESSFWLAAVWHTLWV
jgi:hypothetical protein